MAQRERGDGSSLLWFVVAAVVVFGVGAATVTQRRGVRASGGFVQWSDREMRLLIAELKPLGVNVADALLVYTAESGLDPKASSGIAWGIAQWTARTLKGLGWTRKASEMGTLSIAEQVPWIGKLVAAQIRMIGYVPKTALELYVANFSPKAAQERSSVIYRSPSDAYAKNASLDREKKGWISPADLNVRLDRAKSTKTYQTAVAQAQRLV